jgi:hypothetical protein
MKNQVPPEGAVDTDEETGLPDESGEEYLGRNDE